MNKSGLINWSILVILSLIWGTSFILIKRGLESFNSMQIASLRIFISYLFLMPIAIKNLGRINSGNIFSLLIIGFLGNAIPAFLYPSAQTRIDSSVAGMLNSLTPVFTLVLGLLIYGRKVKGSQVAGIVLGFIGAAGLLYRGSFRFELIGLLIVLATLFYGISSNQVTRIKGLNGLVITSLAFFIVGPIAGIILATSDFSAAMATEHWIRNLGYIAILSIFGSGIALALFNILIQRTTPIFAVSVTYLAPVIAALWGISDGENVTSFMIISVICILSGVYLSNGYSHRKK